MSWWKLVVGVNLAVLSTLGSAATLGAADGLVPHVMHVSLPTGSRQVTLWLEPGFEIGVAASGLPDARVLAQSPTGELVLSQHYQGRVVKLSDPDGDGVVDEIVPILTGLRVPNGVAFAGSTLFVAESDRVLRLDTWWSGGGAASIVSLPGGGHHETRSLVVGPDGRLYVWPGQAATPARRTIRAGPPSGNTTSTAETLRCTRVAFATPWAWPGTASMGRSGRRTTAGTRWARISRRMSST